MAYFSNGTSGELYFEAFCSKCIHDREQDCPIWGLHLEHNYAEANKPGSFLHRLIPRMKDGSNGECRFYTPMQGDMMQEGGR